MGDKFIDKIKFFWGVDSQEEDDYAAEDFYSEMKRDDIDGDEPMNIIEETTPKSTNTIKTSNKILNIHSNAQMNVVLFHPKNFEESTGIVDTLKSRRPVVMNISELDRELARKIFDFCSGALYALDGHIQQVSKGIFVLAPQNVDITGDMTSNKTESTMSSWLKE
ncbi:cell division protein SepF [Fusibacter ferrireducens]|uniref:Cell division protein SepF n=1 Tax=Fusibacter ferrireducens TaxID=2785058 RepID=A0ABR9ZNS2_9FIRM|nr:cell division protein SepF [Fusibacter ferrireducens]MBF4691636.1 cell division protein SepF [Fusibacter ferrireducens]